MSLPSAPSDTMESESNGFGLMSVATGVGALILGELVGGVAEEVTHRIRVHRQELGGPAVGRGSGKYDTLLDLLLDTSVEVVFLLLGMGLVERAMPSVTADLSTMILFIIGLSTQTTHLPGNLKKLSASFLSDSDPLVVSNPDD